MQTGRTKPQPRSSKTKRRQLSDEERHKRFVDMAREVEASDDPCDFDKAFKKVAKGKLRKG